MRQFVQVVAVGGILLTTALLITPSALSQPTDIQFCRDTPEFICMGATFTFSTTDPVVWVLLTIRGEGPYDIRIEWIAPDGTNYFAHTGRAAGGGPYIWRAALAIRGSRAETLPGEWTVRVTINNRQATQAKFTLRLVGDPKLWVPALGLVAVAKAVTARGVESDAPVGEASEFKLTDPVFAYVRLTFPPRLSGPALTASWSWTAPSGEVLEEGRQVQMRPNETALVLWARLSSIEGKVQQPAGNWQVQLTIDNVTVMRLRFTLAP